MLLTLFYPSVKGQWLTPGVFLLFWYNLAALFVPVYLFIAAIMLIRRSVPGRSMVIFTCTIVPFVTLGIYLKLITGSGNTPAERILVAALGEQAIHIVPLTLLLVEIVILLRAAVPPSPPPRMDDPVDQSPGESGGDSGIALGEGDPGDELTDSLAMPGAIEELEALIGGREPDSSIIPSTDNPESDDDDKVGIWDLDDSGTVETLSWIEDSDPADTSGEVSGELDDTATGVQPKVLANTTLEEDEAIREEQLQSAEIPQGDVPDYTPGKEDAGTLGEREAAPDEEDGYYLPHHELDDISEAISKLPGGEFPLVEEESFKAIDEVVMDEPVTDIELDPSPSSWGEGVDTVLEGGLVDTVVQHSQAETQTAVAVVERETGTYSIPIDSLLNEYEDSRYWVIDDETRHSSEVLRLTLEEFKIAAEVTGISRGPVITMFEILPAPGVKLSRIVNLADNIALRLAASRVRIVAPIPGKHAVGIEVPNRERSIVSFREMLSSADLDSEKMRIPVILGKDITGGARVIDLVQTPHLLIAGATGSGKSVCVNSLICSILCRRSPREVKLLLIDPKIVELKLYNDIPHLLTPVITEPKRAFQALQYTLLEMERRYSLLDTLGVKDVHSYNRRLKEQMIASEPLPYIVVVVDEFADLMATSGKEMESTIARLTAMSRAVGIHLVLATQRPSVDVITGLIKANIPSRIAFMVAGKFDSRIIIDEVGAEKLLGKGDMLFTSAWDPHPVRIQGAFLSEEEAERVADHVKSLGPPDYIDEDIFGEDEEEDEFRLMADEGEDPLMETAIGIVLEAGKASASYLQRRLKIGYNRAARLVESMEERGIVGTSNGSKPREVIHVPD